MNISGVSSKSISSLSFQSNSAVNALQKLKTELTNQLNKVNDSKADSKTKAQQIKQLTQQIADVDQQIQQAEQAEKQKKMQETLQRNAVKSAEKEQVAAQDEGNSSGVVLSASLNALLSVSNRLADYKTLGKVRNKLTGEIKVAKTEIAHSVGNTSVKSQMAVVSGNSDKLSSLMVRVGKTAGQIRSESEKAAEEERIASGQSRTGKKVKPQ